MGSKLNCPTISTTLLLNDQSLLVFGIGNINAAVTEKGRDRAELKSCTVSSLVTFPAKHSNKLKMLAGLI